MAVQYSTVVDGEPADPNLLSGVAFAGFAHFTAMQVRDGGVRGLDLHLERLASASRKLFGAELPNEQIRDDLRGAVGSSPPDASLTVTVFDANGEFTNDERPPSLHTLIRTGPPSDGPAGPLALAVFEHERFMPDIKHVGEGAKTFFMRRAREAGFDDAAFTDRRGKLTEASIWNLAFFDGDTVVWPEGEILTGTTMGIVRRQLAERGVPQDIRPITPAAVRELDAAVVMNSWTAGTAVHRIGDTSLPVRPDLVGFLHDVYAAEPLTRL
ncbi:aminotransferase class IV family protein [Nocardia donostiensis]|uniref:Branched-chain amino acid aminotransferase n=1 Tax=Nocardia donostiensis TaxID=1538463 RepID=A0A1V2TGI1_9NOCA|nr:aminotransferase class IV family protein [Nocardia donostiensis]ONM48491.1 branched-chain amino acid aminotransferase [Nocardia donostiensis]OQS16120.1 branched-chain amino acid aminotransferase [Nocardia donostiensis]OQS18982.1 branched-chain amino acid aminotransferase [Nocardia donostiensis]